MLLDLQDAFSSALQTLTTTANSTDYIDKLAAVNLGAGHQVQVAINIGSPTGTPTLTANLVGADDTGFSTNKIAIGSVTPTLTAGTVKGTVYISINPHTPKRYFRLEYTVGGGTPSIPVNFAGLVETAQTAHSTMGALP